MSLRIKYIKLYYGKTRSGEDLHLVRLMDGQGLLYTTDKMVRLGLVKYT